MAFVEAVNKILSERLFKVQDAQEVNDPKWVSATWVKHLYGLVDELNDMQTEMTGMKPKDAILLDQVPLVKWENYPKKINYLRMGCIDTYYNLEKNMMTNGTEQLIGCGIREITDWDRSWKMQAIMWRITSEMDLRGHLYQKSWC